MISLYPSHIPISFPYSHILPYPYIPHIHVSVFLSVPPVALPPVFSHFSFFLYRGRNRMSWCVFLVVFWCRFCGWFSVCLSFRSSTRFARFALLPVFRSALSFRLFVWACRRGGSCGGVWGGAVGLSSGVARCRGVCRVRCFCQLVFVGVVGGFWFSVLHVWRLVCSARLGGAGDAFPVL